MDLHLLSLLPWDLQKMVLAFRPGLPALDSFVQRELRVQMARRYCPVCGEYIDLAKKPARSFPIHFHSSSWHGYKKLYRYTSFRPAVRLHMRPLPKKFRHSMPSYLYHHVYEKDSENEKTRLIVLRKQPLYFFRMEFRKPKMLRLIQMVNTGMLSPFYNPEVFMPGDFQRVFRFDEPERYSLIMDPRRFYPTRSIDQNVCAIFSGFLRDGMSARNLVPLLVRKDCPDGLLAALLPMDGVGVIRNLCLLRRCPRDLLLSVILYDPSLVEHVPEETLRRLFHRYPAVFMDLSPNPFFSLIDPLTSTVLLRSASS